MWPACPDLPPGRLALVGSRRLSLAARKSNYTPVLSPTYLHFLQMVSRYTVAVLLALATAAVSSTASTSTRRLRQGNAQTCEECEDYSPNGCTIPTSQVLCITADASGSKMALRERGSTIADLSSQVIGIRSANSKSESSLQLCRLKFARQRQGC